MLITGDFGEPASQAEIDRIHREYRAKHGSVEVRPIRVSTTPDPPMTGRAANSVEAVFREERGRLLVRQLDDLDLAEEVASDAVASALRHWPVDGVSTRPAAWLLTMARRRDLLRQLGRPTDVATRLPSCAGTGRQ